jgi:hypothetical protein
MTYPVDLVTMKCKSDNAMAMRVKCVCVWYVYLILNMQNMLMKQSAITYFLWQRPGYSVLRLEIGAVHFNYKYIPFYGAGSRHGTQSR